MNTIYLEPKQVPAELRGSYTGTKFKAHVTDRVTIPADAGLWSGGTRTMWSVVSLDHGKQLLPGQHLDPWTTERHEKVIELSPSIVVVEHDIFCGKDMGLTFYVHPDSAQKLLPPPAEDITAFERIVLDATCSYKSSYGGKDRYDMAQDNVRYSPTPAPFPSRAEWETAKQSLIGRGYLNKAGAVTTAGRNARGSKR